MRWSLAYPGTKPQRSIESRCRPFRPMWTAAAFWLGAMLWRGWEFSGGPDGPDEQAGLVPGESLCETAAHARALHISAENRSNFAAVAASPWRDRLSRYSLTVNGGLFRRLRTLRIASQKAPEARLR